MSAASIAAGLRDFGYDDVTPQMASDILDAIKDGKSGDDLPHGSLGVLIERLAES